VTLNEGLLPSVIDEGQECWRRCYMAYPPHGQRWRRQQHQPPPELVSLVSLHGVKEWLSRVVDGGDHTREEHSTSATKRGRAAADLAQ
jgi:hypothetical protein